MRVVLPILAVAAIIGSCSALPIPITSGVPSTPESCSDRFTEQSCKEGRGCRWINDSRRADGTYATAHCTSE